MTFLSSFASCKVNIRRTLSELSVILAVFEKTAVNFYVFACEL
jgi:hypothetical protein